MADGDKTASSVVTLNLGDPKLWALIAALAGGQFAASKLSISGVENQQQHVAETASRAVEKQATIDDKLGEIKSAQDLQFGELRYRLEQVEKRLGESNEKGKRP